MIHQTTPWNAATQAPMKAISHPTYDYLVDVVDKCSILHYLQLQER